jgi:hypothetical protein
VPTRCQVPTKPEEGATPYALKIGCVAHREAFSVTLAREIRLGAETVRVKILSRIRLDCHAKKDL